MATNRAFSEAPVRWIGAVREGLSVDLVDDVLTEGRLTPAELDRLALPRKTLAHRRTLGRLTAEQSDRLMRILRLVETAEHTFGDPARRRTHGSAAQPPRWTMRRRASCWIPISAPVRWKRCCPASPTASPLDRGLAALPPPACRLER